jgi:Kef-type K+ transport system membrane component KefB
VPGAGESLFWIALCAVLAPLLAGLVLRNKVPEVVLLLVLGVLIGPNVLELAVAGEGVTMLRELGLGMLFLLAGAARSSRGSPACSSRSASCCCSTAPARSTVRSRSRSR